MEPSDRRPSPAPSLIDDGAARSSTQARGHEPTRILASLEGRVGTAASLPHRRGGKRLVIAAVALLVAGALIVGWWAVEHVSTRPSWDDPATVVARNEPPSNAVDAPRAPAASAVATPAEVTEVATIVNFPPPGRASQSQSDAQSVSQSEVQPAQSQATSTHPAASSPHPEAALAQASRQSSARSNTSAARRRPVVAQRTPARAASITRRKAGTSPAAPPRDPDVDLLAAMLTHLDNPASQSPAIAPRIEERIAQCNALGYFEAKACRLRVCSGRKDAACVPEGAQPAASNPVSK